MFFVTTLGVQYPHKGLDTIHAVGMIADVMLSVGLLAIGLLAYHYGSFSKGSLAETLLTVTIGVGILYSIITISAIASAALT